MLCSNAVLEQIANAVTAVEIIVPSARANTLSTVFLYMWLMLV